MTTFTNGTDTATFSDEAMAMQLRDETSGPMFLFGMIGVAIGSVFLVARAFVRIAVAIVTGR